MCCQKFSKPTFLLKSMKKYNILNLNKNIFSTSLIHALQSPRYYQLNTVFCERTNY